jgi:tetratricopeptide (TPR) repeat protein/tRNA A-37 threonylcarbamoyl transferase component Bud32
LTPAPGDTADATAPGADSTFAPPPALAAAGPRSAAGDDRATVLPPPTGETASPTPPPGMLAPGQSIGPRYQIIRLLGVGGMGAVYHAWDAVLGLAVAVKVIRPEMIADPAAAAAIERRFKRELLLARQVTHKHVVRIHDIGEVDGMKYITMPYVQGADLATVLRRAGRLSVQRSLAYARQIVGGLVAAHDAGVVHRDLKPANVMIDQDDQALIMDFGIARSADGSSGSVAGRVVGTLAYMAPEQAQGKDTDQRADVYAVGMMLSEMLVGRRTSAATEQDALTDLMQRMREAPPRTRTIDPAIPEALDEIVARCVEPDAARRFQTSRDLASALAAIDDNGHRLAIPVGEPQPVRSRLRLAAIAAAALVVIALGGVWMLRRPPPAPAQPIQPVAILVADFDNKTGDAVFDGALEQPLTIAMEGASFVTAYPRRDALKVAQGLKGADARLDGATARLIAFREGVKLTLLGSVAKQGSQFALALDLVDTDGKVVQSAKTSAASKGEVLTAVGALAAKLRAAIGDKTVDTAKPAGGETFTAASLDAFHEYAIAQDVAFAGRDEEAIAHYRRAIEFDDNFGRAYSGLAVASQRLGRIEEATAAYNKALSLVDRMNEREKYRTLGAYYLGSARNYEKAVENYTALLRAYPGDSAGQGNLAYAEFFLHHFPKALEEGRRAVVLNPKNVMQQANVALYAMYAGDFDGAATMAKKVLTEQGGYVTAHLPLVVDAVARNDSAAAVQAYDQMAKAGVRGASLAAIGRADLALYSGRLDEAQRLLEREIPNDLAAKNTSGAARKQLVLAETLTLAGKRAAAIKAAADGLALTRELETLVPAGRVAIANGRAADARAIAAELEGQLQKQNRAYGKIILAEIALSEKKTTEAADLLGQARELADLWLGRFDLGLAYVQASHFAEAVSELEACEKRRGEATALFFDDTPTVRYLATLPYWIGRAQEGLGMAGPARTRYEAFLNLRKDATGDPLVADARQRIGTAR